MKQVFYTYILKCSDSTFYTGHTNNIKLRLLEHNKGQVPGYTMYRRPVILVYLQEFRTRNDAFQFERQIKNWSRAKKLALIEKNEQVLKALARKLF
jgi:predicted GIY-YIG superfamily endonuclease